MPFFIPLPCLLELVTFILWLFSAISCSISVKLTQNPWTTTHKSLISRLLFYMLYLKTKCSWSSIKTRKIKMFHSKNIGMGCLDNTKSTLPSPFCLVAKIKLSQTDAVWWKSFSLWEFHLLTENGSTNTSCCIFQQVFSVQHPTQGLCKVVALRVLWTVSSPFSNQLFKVPQFVLFPLSTQPLDSYFDEWWQH